MEKVAVIGAGLMGHGIAQVFAVNGHAVALHDADEAVRAGVRDRIARNLDELGQAPAALDAIAVPGTLAGAVEDAGLVVECIAENLAAKQALFAAVEPLARPDAVLATNTSVIRVTDIMGGLERRGRALATHWWNPPHLVPLVEIIGTPWTDPAVIDATMALHASLGQTPVHVQRDVNGSIGNRLQMAMWREAMHLVETGVADAATVDAVVKASFGRRLAVLGPMENADLIGLELTRAIHANLFATLDARPHPSPLLDERIAAGHGGMRTGEGLRRWTPEDAEATRVRLATHLARAKIAER